MLRQLVSYRPTEHTSDSSLDGPSNSPGVWEVITLTWDSEVKALPSLPVEQAVTDSETAAPSRGRRTAARAQRGGVAQPPKARQGVAVAVGTSAETLG